MLLADYIRSQAEWRKGKAEQHPDDARNARSARALGELAETVEAMEETPGEADLIASIEEELSRRSGGVAKPGELVSREVSRYGFDAEAPEPARSSVLCSARRTPMWHRRRSIVSWPSSPRTPSCGQTFSRATGA